MVLVGRQQRRSGCGGRRPEELPSRVSTIRTARVALHSGVDLTKSRPQLIWKGLGDIVCLIYLIYCMPTE